MYLYMYIVWHEIFEGSAFYDFGRFCHDLLKKVTEKLYSTGKIIHTHFTCRFLLMSFSNVYNVEEFLNMKIAKINIQLEKKTSSTIAK